MVMSLFSVFDPVAMGGVSFNWLALMLVCFFFPFGSFVVGGGFEGFMKWMVGFIESVFSEVSFPNFLGLVMMSIVMLMYLSMENMIGLFPFVFTGTSHLVVTFSLGLVLWMSSVLMGWVSETKSSLAHLVPEGSPLVLGPFMVLIELISQLIRPVTLSVRLAANMMAGHLIIGLIASISVVSLGGMVVSVFLQTLMLILEVAVALIQAFVFSILVMLYCLEYY